MKKIQSGFTLIELMIVVAIIGILAAIAIPQYQNYVARAQVSEALVLASGAKTGVSEYISTNGTMPTSNTEAGIATTIKGSYVESVVVGAGGVITMTFQEDADADTPGNAHSAIATRTMILEPTKTDGSIVWTCSQGTAATKIDETYLPASCK
tara:strand:+ start:74 stop:532 length:459 start_codon:yes stop_codon:yes gene_type:complete